MDTVPYTGYQAMQRMLDTAVRLRNSTMCGVIACIGIVVLIAMWPLAHSVGPLPGNEHDDDDAHTQSRAEYVLNFVRYAEWPEEAFHDEESPIVIIVLGHDPMITHLRHMITEKRINVRRIRLRQLDYPTPPSEQDEVDEETLERFHQRLQRAHMVYFSADDHEYEYVARALEAIKCRPIFTIGNHPRFIKRGGMLGLVAGEDRVEFDVNVKNMRKCGVMMSSHVLRLARMVIDEEDEDHEEEARR